MTRMPPAIAHRGRVLLAGALVTACLVVSQGCETDSFLDPSRTGYFEFVPTTMPVLKRLDVVEQATFDNAIIGPPEPEDLLPGTTEYVLGPGDVLRIEIFELVQRGETEVSLRTVDPDGYIRLPVLGSVPATGLTIQQFTDLIKDRLVSQQIILQRPIVNVSPEETRSYQYKMMGSIERGGLFALNRSDLRLTDALALAQGAFPTTRTIRVIRTVQSPREVPPDTHGTAPAPATRPPATVPPAAGVQQPSQPSTTAPPVDIDALIDQLNIQRGPSPTPGEGRPQAAPSGSTTDQAKPAPGPSGNFGALRDSPAPTPMLARQTAAIDIDTLEPVRIADAPVVRDARRQQVTVEQPSDGSTFVFDPEKQEWVRVRPGSMPPPGAAPLGAKTGPAAAATRKRDTGRYSGPPTRIIEINYQDLMAGVPGLDIVVRPGDTIVADAGERGVVYIDGEVIRPGVYQLPEGGRLTVSRLIAAAGGLNQVAIPERCDLIRNIGEDREATIRFSLAAIRSRGEPDIYMKPDDHVIIGTNFWATPLAVIRNGFRMTYGFGFLLDRNFGNDVFGPPPVNVVGQ